MDGAGCIYGVRCTHEYFTKCKMEKTGNIHTIPLLTYPGGVISHSRKISQSLSEKNQSQSLTRWDGKIYIDRREAPEIFEGNFAYNWSLCVGKIQRSLGWSGKNLSQPLKRLEKYCPEIWDRIFPTSPLGDRITPNLVTFPTKGFKKKPKNSPAPLAPGFLRTPPQRGLWPQNQSVTFKKPITHPPRG
jgi:hypothetical protein